MKLIIQGRNRVRGLGLVIAALAGALALATAAPALSAPAGLGGTDWIAATLPDGNYVADGSNGNPISPVSCVSGTKFCLAVVSNQSVTGPNNLIGQSSVVTTDGGLTWNAYTGLPSSSIYVTSASSPTTSTCWVAGPGPEDQPEVAESVDGGQTWTLQTPADWASAGWSWWPNAIDCVSETVCWLAGMTANSIQTPVVAETTDGTNWTTFSNLPTITQYDPNGTYLLNAISCTSPLACVAGGGLNEGDGEAQVISTTDGGATWTLSTDPTLQGVQQIFGLSCLPTVTGLPTCTAAADALAAAGPVVISSSDGGATWSGMETLDNTGWMSSISCPDASHCWGAGAGTSVALVGTADGGGSWSAVSADTTNEDGRVSCASVTFCVATTDNDLWVTTDGGGLGAAARPFVTKVTQKLPHVSGANVSGRAGQSVRVTGQYRGIVHASTATVTIIPPGGQATTSSVPIGLNEFYSVVIGRLAAGTTSVRFVAGDAKPRTIKVHGYTAVAPTIQSLNVHAGGVAGGTFVTVRGTSFWGITGVDFGTVPGLDVHVVSSTELTVRSPAGSGAVYVTVIRKNGGPSPLTGRSVFNFLPRPAVKSLSPASGPAGGGNRVTVKGSGIAFVRAVYFGSHKATHLTVISSTRLRVTAPAGAGKVTVTVVTAGGTSRAAPGDVYTY